MFWPPEIPQYAAEAQATLSAWDGCVWRLDGYSMTHSAFALWVYAAGRPTSLRVSCLSSRYVCGPTGWNGCRFTVRAVDATLWASSSFATRRRTSKSAASTSRPTRPRRRIG